MKNRNVRIIGILLFSGIMYFAGCNKPVEDFGFDGQLQGKIVDNEGNLVSGNTRVATFEVHALGEFDVTDMAMRIKADGTYANTKLYPQSYKVWLQGPFIGGKTDTIVIDLTGGKSITHDFTVTPLLTIHTPVLNGSPSSTSISVNYNMVGNGGNIPNLREIYCSTVSWPTRDTGAGGTTYTTQTATVTDDQGTVTFNELKPGTRYFIRVGARATGQSQFNHSDQIVITTASN